MAEEGQEEPFPARRLSCREAPKPAICTREIELVRISPFPGQAGKVWNRRSGDNCGCQDAAQAAEA